ncbi:MAG: nickel/cobalt transporter [Thermomicrobiales bacterium]
MVRRSSARSLARTVIALIALVVMLCLTQPLSAHPADEINERDLVHINADGMTIEMTVSAGALTLRRPWADADTNGDGVLDEQEQNAYGALLARGIHLTTDGVPTPLTYVPGTLAMKTTLRDFTLQGADATGATVFARFAAPFDGLGVPHEVTIAVEHYTHVEYGRPAELYPDAAAPTGIIIQGGNDVSLRVTTTPGGAITAPIAPPPPSNPNHRPVAALQRFVRVPVAGLSFTLTGLGIAMLLGALHALTPGHGKTLVAAYMIGSRGRIRDAVTLGGVVTITHTGSVIAAGVVMLVCSRAFAPDRFLPWIELAGSLSIIGLGIALLPSRVSSARLIGRRARSHASAAPRIEEHEHEHEDGTRHTHGWFGSASHIHPPLATHDLRSLLMLGVGGGIVPCPDALAILLIAVAAGHIITGLIIILGFSVGLAAVLTGLGILLTTVRMTRLAPGRLIGAFGIARWLPVASAVMIVAIGVNGLWRAASIM